MYQPSDTEKARINEVFSRFSDMDDLRSRKYREFGMRRDPDSGYEGTRNLIDFVDDSEKRFMGHIPPKSDLMDAWQARVFVNMTRDIVISWLAKVGISGVKMKFTATDRKGRPDIMRTFLIDKLHEYSRGSQHEQFVRFLLSMDGTVKGTAIGYEGYRDERRNISEITGYDPATGEVKSKKVEKREAGCTRERIPIDEFFIGNPKQPEIKKQPDICWRQNVMMDEAAMDFAKFPRWKDVEDNRGSHWQGLTKLPFYRENLFGVLDENGCEVLRYYNRRKDLYAIIANGVLLYYGPSPFHHKEYPFTPFRFEINSDLFWGNSLPNKFAHNQDIVNALWNMGLDRMILSLQRPVMTDDDEVVDTVWAPHSILKVGDMDRWKEMDVKPPDASYFSMLQLAQKFSMDNSGIVGGSSGTTPRGGKITARQALLMEEQAREIMGLSLNTLESFEAESSKLRAQNILQFYALPEVEEVVGLEGKENYRKFFIDKSFRVRDTSLSDGTRGNVEIRVLDEEKLPTREDVEVEEEVAMMRGENLEVLAVSPAYIRNMQIDVRPVPGSSFERSKVIEQELEREFYLDMQANPYVDQVEITREYIRSRDKDPDKLVLTQAPANPGMGQTARPPAGAAGQSPDLSVKTNPQKMPELGALK